MRIGIVGYGNLGRGVEAAITKNPDMKLVAVFTRRDPAAVRLRTGGVPVMKYESLPEMKEEIDVIVNCGGSATDLPESTPEIAEYFNVVDSFDTHANIPAHFEKINSVAEANKTVAIISVGWDPGMFSLNRIYAESILPVGESYTFWGRGVSQGHSDAVRRIDGVIDARQYTVPVEKALERVRSGENPALTTREKHTRECYVVAEEGADTAAVEKQIKEMPNYFSDYDTTVHFISAEEMKREHSSLPHGGSVIRSGVTGINNENRHTIEYSLKLASNPEFTAGVLLAYARAAYRLGIRGQVGCKTVFDVAPCDISPLTPSELRAKLL